MRTAIRLSEIPMKEVESSTIGRVGYKDKVLVVEFHNGGKYIYIGDTELYYKNMISGKLSVGKYFAETIKNNIDLTCIQVESK